MSLAALRRCIALGNLSPDDECLAYLGLAELGFRLAKARWTGDKGPKWARGLESEVDKAIGKGVLIAQRNPSLALYKQALTLIHAKMEHWQQNEKFSRSQLRSLTNDFSAPKSFATPKSSPWFIYTTHLTTISHALSSTTPDMKTAFGALDTLKDVAHGQKDSAIVLFTHVLRLRILIDAATWNGVQSSLDYAESCLGLVFKDTSESKSPGKGKTKETDFIMFDNAFEAAMAIHTLILGVVYYTHIGQAGKASPRLSHLHALLDYDALKLFPEGTLEIKLSSGAPLKIKCTHPRVLFNLAYLVSSSSKRDAAGRKPKRKVFAVEGLKVMDAEKTKEVILNVWAEPQDADEVYERVAKMKADMMSELVAVCIMRSEFEEAAKALDELISHTRSFDIFTTYSARITLHHAHLAHALGALQRAAQCYEVAAHLSDKGTFVNVAARAGYLALSIARGDPCTDDIEDLAKDSRGMGWNLEAIVCTLRACTAKEIQGAKSLFKEAIDLASSAQDNYFRALILALVSSLYLRTAPDHARKMLEISRQLALGLGASKKADHKGTTPNLVEKSVGNAPLGLWVGERFLELHLRQGDEEAATCQKAANVILSEAAARLPERRLQLLGL